MRIFVRVEEDVPGTDVKVSASAELLPLQLDQANFDVASIIIRDLRKQVEERVKIEKAGHTLGIDEM